MDSDGDDGASNPVSAGSNQTAAAAGGGGCAADATSDGVTARAPKAKDKVINRDQGL